MPKFTRASRKKLSDAMKRRWAEKRAEKAVIDSAQKVTEHVLGQMPEKPEGGSYNQITSSSGCSVKEHEQREERSTYLLAVRRPDGTTIELIERSRY